LLNWFLLQKNFTH